MPDSFSGQDVKNIWKMCNTFQNAVAKRKDISIDTKTKSRYLFLDFVVESIAETMIYYDLDTVCCHTTYAAAVCVTI